MKHKQQAGARECPHRALKSRISLRLSVSVARFLMVVVVMGRMGMHELLDELICDERGSDGGCYLQKIWHDTSI